MIQTSLKLKLFSKGNEDWVSKTLKTRQLKPIIISIFLVFLIFSYSTYNSYLEYDKEVVKKEKIDNRILKYKKLLKNVEETIKKKEKEIVDINSLSLDSKPVISMMNKLCELLKKREVIGSFYIIKRQNKEFVNVLNLEVQISYGDKDTLMLVSKILLDKVFYLKNIQRTKKGITAEVYNPVKDNNNDE